MRKTTEHLTFSLLFIVILLFNPATAISQTSKSSYPTVLLDNIWEVEYDKSDSFPILIKFFDNGYMVNVSVHTIENKSIPTFVSGGIDLKYTVIDNVLSFSTYTFDFKGKIDKDKTIKGKGRNGYDKFTKLRIAKNQELIDYFNRKNLFSFSPLSVLPQYKNELSGKLNSSVDVINTFDFYVAVAIVGNNKASYFIAAPDGGIGFRLIPNGRYETYYVYYNEPDSLYQGDDITVNDQQLTITLEQVTGGNYNIRKSK